MADAHTTFSHDVITWCYGKRKLNDTYHHMGEQKTSLRKSPPTSNPTSLLAPTFHEMWRARIANKPRNLLKLLLAAFRRRFGFLLKWTCITHLCISFLNIFKNTHIHLLYDVIWMTRFLVRTHCREKDRKHKL